MLGYDEKNESIEVAKQFTAYQKPQERWIPLDADKNAKMISERFTQNIKSSLIKCM